MLDNFQDGVSILFAVGMGFHQVQEKVIRAVFGGGVPDNAVGDGDFTLPLDQSHGRPITSEVEELSRAG
jgi:hypothetical protein